MSWYVLCLGGLFLVVLPLIGPWLVCFKVFVVTGQWEGWQMNEALRAIWGGLVITPFAAFFLTLEEYSRHRGWSQRFFIIVIVLIAALLFAVAEYAKLHGWWK